MPAHPPLTVHAQLSPALLAAHLISSPCQSHCLRFRHAILFVNISSSFFFSLSLHTLLSPFSVSSCITRSLFLLFRCCSLSPLFVLFASRASLCARCLTRLSNPSPAQPKLSRPSCPLPPSVSRLCLRSILGLAHFSYLFTLLLLFTFSMSLTLSFRLVLFTCFPPFSMPDSIAQPQPSLSCVSLIPSYSSCPLSPFMPRLFLRSFLSLTHFSHLFIFPFLLTLLYRSALILAVVHSTILLFC